MKKQMKRIRKDYKRVLKRIEKLRREVDVPITVLKPPHPLEWYMNNYLLTKGKWKGRLGYGFPRPHARWCTRIKNETISRYLCGGELQCVGIAADEDRPQVDGRRYPLIEWGVTERDALDYCLARGFTWGGALRAHGQGFVLVLSASRTGFGTCAAQGSSRAMATANRYGARMHGVPEHVPHRLQRRAA